LQAVHARAHMDASGRRDGGSWRGIWPILVRDPYALASTVWLALMILIALLAPLIAPETYGSYDYTHGGAHPELNLRYLFGADVSGHSILSLIILGARTSLGVAALATAVALTIAVVIVYLIARSPRWVQSSVMFLVDGGMMLPFLPLVIVLAAFVTGGNPWGFGLILGFCGAPAVVVAAWRSTRYRSAPITAGDRTKDSADPTRVSALAPQEVVRLATLCLSAFLVVAATVDFIGFGLPPSNPSWGNALSEVTQYFDAGYWWWVLFPGLAIFLTLLAINTLGRAIVLAWDRSCGVAD
jgi:peptide/nickel transport system permease protein